MSEPFEKIEDLKTILWPDAALQKFEANFERAVLHFIDTASVERLIYCEGYIGFQLIGFWDEVIIEKATLYSHHSFITQCESRLKVFAPSGEPLRSQKENRVLEVTFIDGCALLICANAFNCKTIF